MQNEALLVEICMGSVIHSRLAGARVGVEILHPPPTCTAGDGIRQSGNFTFSSLSMRCGRLYQAGNCDEGVEEDAVLHLGIGE